MTILPKKKSSQAKSDRDNSGGVDSVSYPPRGLPQTQSVVANANAGPGWGPSVGPSGTLSTGWSPQSGSRVEREDTAKKRAPPFNYDDEEVDGPSPSKGRLRNPDDPDDQDGEGGYNSEDEYNHLGVQLTEEEWLEKDRKFELMMRKKGYIIKTMVDDGSCLFRAVADQLYGDQEMHPSVRKHCMDYIAQNSDYYSQYVTEDILEYVARKRYLGVHGNHLEIQALSEMYNRPIHIYCYSAEPINIFQGMFKTETINAPMRLCYHRLCHYNSIVDPVKPTVGVGLGLPGYSPGSADRNQVKQAVKNSESDLVEKTMLEDKIKATDWEATNEAIEEQVARESYLQWLRDNERRHAGNSKSATVTSADLRATCEATSPSRAKNLVEEETKAARSSPKPSCSHTSSEPALQYLSSPKAGCSSQRDSPKPCSSSQPQSTEVPASGNDYGLGTGFELEETASFLNRLPPTMFGLDDWNDTDVLTQVLAASQQEYLNSLKKAAAAKESESRSRRSSSDSSDQERDQNNPNKNNKNNAS